MADDLVQQLLQRLLETGMTVEEVCARHPDLCDEVRRRLRLMQEVEVQLEAMFPAGPEAGAGAADDAGDGSQDARRLLARLRQELERAGVPERLLQLPVEQRRRWLELWADAIAWRKRMGRHPTTPPPDVPPDSSGDPTDPGRQP
jgi:hypothetical protein